MSGIDLLITGLCSFVPKHPIEEEHSDQDFTVLLVESAQPLPGHSGHAHSGHELHVPVLVCPEKYVVSGGAGGMFRFPDATFRSTPYPNQAGDNADEPMAVFYLDDQEITIALDSNPGNSEPLSIDLDSVKQCPSAESNLSSFHWVAPLANLNPGSEKVRKACFEPRCDPSVTARLLLREGHLTTAKLATDLDQRILLWNFADVRDAEHHMDRQPEGPVSRAIAAIVGVHFELGSGQGIEFTTTLFQKETGYRSPSNRRVEALFKEAPERPRKIRLEPVEDASPRVWVMNLPWLDVLQIRPQTERLCDVHFAHLYKISEISPDVALKVPCATNGMCFAQPKDLRHGGGIDCPMDQRQARNPTLPGNR